MLCIGCHTVMWPRVQVYCSTFKLHFVMNVSYSLTDCVTIFVAT